MACSKIMLQAPGRNPEYLRSVLSNSVKAHLHSLGFNTSEPKETFITVDGAAMYERRNKDGQIVEFAHVVPYQ